MCIRDRRATELTGFSAQRSDAIRDRIGFKSLQECFAVALTCRTAPAIQKSKPVERITHHKGGVLATDPTGTLLQGLIQHTRQPGNQASAAQDFTC